MSGIWRHRTIEAAFPRLNVNARPGRVYRCFQGFLESHPLTVVDVGARGGATPEISSLAPAIHLVALEADEASADQLRVQMRGSPFRTVNVIHATAGPPGGRFRLRVTDDPAKSSVFEPNHEVLARYGDGDAYTVVEEREIETEGLGEILSANGIECVDLIKLDVQGFESEVLRSLEPDHLGNVLFAEIEVEFVELYRGQPLFRHVDELLASCGFELFHLSRSFANYTGGRWMPYGRGQMLFADASYLRTRTETLSPARLGKLIVLASYYGFTDYAYYLYRENAQRLGELDEAHRRSFDVFFAEHRRRRAHPLRVTGTLLKAVLDRLLFHYLCWRRWNGLKTDTDRAYPTR